jgi:hypothetical protein
MCIWMYSITLSHFARITWIFEYNECHNHVWKKEVSYLILWVMDMDRWQSHLRLGAHLKRWQKKQNVKTWTWIFLQLNEDESSHLLSRGQNPLSYYTRMILKTISLPYDLANNKQPNSKLISQSQNEKPLANVKSHSRSLISPFLNVYIYILGITHP